MRHLLLNHMKRRHHKLYIKVINELSPCEALPGVKTGCEPTLKVIPLPNHSTFRWRFTIWRRTLGMHLPVHVKPRVWKQLTLEESFAMSRKKKSKKQLTLTEVFARQVRAHGDATAAHSGHA